MPCIFVPIEKQFTGLIWLHFSLFKFTYSFVSSFLILFWHLSVLEFCRFWKEKSAKMTAKISVGHAEYETCDCYIIVCMYCKNLWMWNLVAHKLTHWIVIITCWLLFLLPHLLEVYLICLNWPFLKFLVFCLYLSLFLTNAIQYMISWLSINDSTNTPVLLLYLTDEKSWTNRCWIQNSGMVATLVLIT